MKHYEVRDGSESGHCCFVATVVDTTKQTHIVANGRPVYEVVCECFSREAADEVCAALNASDEHKKLKEELKIAREEIERLSAEVCALREDAQRWRWLDSNARLGFACLPSLDAVIRIPVLDRSDNTISALVDRALAESR